jgi:hypothetical protein
MHNAFMEKRGGTLPIESLRARIGYALTQRCSAPD